MKRSFFALFALVAVTTQTLAADRSYLCIGELSTGFIFRQGRWATTTFNVDKDKFLVAVKGLDITVTRIGDEYPTHTCSLAAEDTTGFVCGGLGTGFRMYFDTLRYQDFYGFGFVEGEDDGLNTPATTIGRCSPV